MTIYSYIPVNQLVSSSDEELGESSFYYDQNGNLEMTLLPDSIRLGYRYNQRNLLEQAFRQAGPRGPEIMQAAFVYDGNANRVQQIDYSGGQPVTITYTNDILGMTQVLLADDGTTTTANLFGLSLIHQDDGAQMRFLLADGLGSVRQELAGRDLQTTTTYEPYGKLLTQTGTSGTTYGFTGEQEDAATGLVYLRARYYNPTLNQFQSRDPFPGYAKLPQSQNGYSYVHANPVNHTDPSGLCIVGYSGEVRDQYPYGTSGICPNTEHWITEANAAMMPLPHELPITAWTKDYQGVDALIHFFALHSGGADHRLEMLLRQTAGNNGKRIPFNIQIQFGVQIPGGPNLCPQFEDQHHYSNPTFQWGGGASYQMSHFLTAVALAYDTTHPNRRATGVAGARLLFGGRSHSNVEAALRLIVGHEMRGDQWGPRTQYRVVNNQHINDFISAVSYDVAGNDAERDRLLLGILGPEDLVNRTGNSLEDLRLSAKGWIFGHHIAQGIIRTSQDAAAWLRDNLVSRQ